MKKDDQLLDHEVPKKEAEQNLVDEEIQAEKSLEELLGEELEKQKEVSKNNYEQYLRALAEVENIKKRTQRDREEYIKYGNVTLIKRILPILDDMERAVHVAQTANDTEALCKGVEMTAKSLADILIGEGLVLIETQGKPFDPQYHQALTVETNDEYPENTVIEELQRGYILHDRVIRPALVKVSGA